MAFSEGRRVDGVREEAGGASTACARRREQGYGQGGGL
eukprot:CAMPEP_0174887014 /NCGR_PEP_ID=MMETSP0167-20121228/2233_1 /TAXON_ID=38298 /ORGANISM="Rhodella maculata, Strain CCMP736" /LENGTH=37 /DNA_ID= /DNA_START= /DNA_END= /DNA_ORIENTATION=